MRRIRLSAVRLALLHVGHRASSLLPPRVAPAARHPAPFRLIVIAHWNKTRRPDVAEIIDEQYEREPDGWRKRRLLAIKLVAHGEMTSAQIADKTRGKQRSSFVRRTDGHGGKIGGYAARKSDPPSETECLWRRLEKLRCYVEIGQAFGAL